MRKEPLIGTWKLISCETRRSDGEVLYPYGKQPLGQLIYDPAGNMAVAIMRPGRVKFSIPDKFQGTPGETKSAFDGFESYWGTYEIDEEQNTVIHHVEGSLFPNWEGGTQTRFVEVSPHQLTLSTPLTPYGGATIIALLVWERKV